jgi:hypothetical protein
MNQLRAYESLMKSSYIRERTYIQPTLKRQVWDTL